MDDSCLDALSELWLSGVLNFGDRFDARGSFVKVDGSLGFVVEGDLGTFQVFGGGEVVAPSFRFRQIDDVFLVRVTPLAPMDARSYSKTWETFEEVIEDVKSLYFDPKDMRIREMFRGIRGVKYVEQTQNFERHAAYLKLLMEARAAGLVAQLTFVGEAVLVRLEEAHEKNVRFVPSPDEPSSGRFGALRFDGDGWLNLEIRKVGNDPQEFVVEKTVELANVHEVVDHL